MPYRPVSLDHINIFARNAERSHKWEVGEDAQGPQQKQVGLNHVAWRVAGLEDLAAMYDRRKALDVPVDVCGRRRGRR